MELTKENSWLIRAARAHMWELWLLIGLPFVGSIVAAMLGPIILAVSGPLLPAVSVTDPWWDFEYSHEIDLPFLTGIVPLILLVYSYRLVNNGDRPLLVLLWKYAMAEQVIWLTRLLVITYILRGAGNLELYLALVMLLGVISLGLLVAFGRAASRRGFKNALLFIVATGFLGSMGFGAGVPGYSDWTIVMSLLTGIYGTALTLAAVWAVRRADSNGVLGWNLVVIPMAALLLFLTTELAVQTALTLGRFGLDDGWAIGRLLLAFGFTLAGYLIGAGLVYLVRLRNPAPPPTTDTCPLRHPPTTL